MAATDMRLRLIIRRHGLPEVKLVWPCAASDDLTVASLLAQVNDVVTLESGQWGLEDYAVELADQDGGSFECLHFQPVGKLLKQDDQVVIRSLLTEDLRQRRISGRHQISGDGIHLVDGIPFGRRRGPRDRPALPLPPRKRARITYDSSEEDDEEDTQDPSQLLLEDTPRPGQIEEDDGSEDDADYGTEDDSGDDYDEEGDYADALAAELRFIQEDNGTFEDTPGNVDDHTERVSRRRREKETNGKESSSQLLKLEGMTPAAVIALKAAFPLTPQPTIEAKLDGRNSNLEATYKELASANDPALGYDAMMSIFMENRFNHVLAPEPALLRETPRASKPLIQEVEDLQESEPPAADESDNGVVDAPVSSSECSDSDDSSSSSDSGDESDQIAATLEDGLNGISPEAEEAIFRKVFAGLGESGDDQTSDSGSSGSSADPHGTSNGASIEKYADDSRSEGSDDSHDSIQEVSNDGSAVQKAAGLGPLIEDVTPTAPSDQSSSGEDSSSDASSDTSSEDLGSDGSSDSESDNAGSPAGPRQVSSIFQKAFPDAEFGRSSESDSSDSSSDDSDDEMGSNSSEQSEKASDEDSPSDSEEDSGASSEEETKAVPTTVPVKQAQKTRASLDESKAPAPAEAATQPEVGRGQGLSRTQKRNARRRLAKQKLREKEGSKLPSEPTVAGNASGAKSNLVTELVSNADQDVAMEDLSLSQRRRELARAIQDAEVASSDGSSSSISSSSSESDSDSGSGPEEESSAQQGNRPKIEVVESVDTEQPQEHPVTTPNTGKHSEIALLPVDSSGLPVGTPNTATVQDDSARKRTRVDMGAGRRLLFGALGLKNPKTKADEEKVKKDLMKDVRPHQNHRQQVSESAVDGGHQSQPRPQAAEEEDDWREKITYRAVECCHEGMDLSEPPFPFVQRWDPQQQYNAMRKRKRDSQHFEEYYEEDSWYGQEGNGSSKKKKKNKKRALEKQQDASGYNEDYLELDYDDPPSKPEAGDTQATDLDDLPSLPADPSSLPPIGVEDAKVGMVITWQRLELSKPTNWQPQMQWVTGMIVSKEAKKINLLLAKRDRTKDERVFDEDGNRLYDKFEMPDEDDLEEDYKPDDGHRQILWDELTEARLVQGEPSPSMLNSPVEESFVGPDVRSFIENTEAGSQPPASSNNDVDSVQLRAGVEEDLRNTANEGEEAQGSFSIPSGQNHALVGFTGDADGQPLNGNVSEEPSQPSTSDKTARGDSQLRKKSSDVVVKDSQNIGPQLTKSDSKPLHDSLGDRIAATDDDEVMADNGDESHNQDDQDARNTPSVNVTYASSQADGQKEQTPSVDYPQLPIPSSASSLRSGRQPQSDCAEPANDEDEGKPIPESGPSALLESASASEEQVGAQDKAHSRESSSDSFPALDDIWHTAKTSKTQQSPLKSSQGSALAHKNKKMKLEPVSSSQKLSNGDTPNGTKSSRNLFPNATQPESELPTASTPRRSSRRRSQAKSSPFTIPDGSQVITLSSSPVSEKYEENYAEDEVDDTYKDPDSSSLPKGAGWVAKKQKPPRRGRARKAST